MQKRHNGSVQTAFANLLRCDSLQVACITTKLVLSMPKTQSKFLEYSSCDAFFVVTRLVTSDIDTTPRMCKEINKRLTRRVPGRCWPVPPRRALSGAGLPSRRACARPTPKINKHAFQTHTARSLNTASK